MENYVKVLRTTRKLTANREKWKSIDISVINIEAEPVALKLRTSGKHTSVPVKTPAKHL